MQVYWQFGKRSFQRAMAYRAATLAGLATNFFFGLVRAMLFAAFYESAVETPAMPQWQAISYVWLVQALLALGFWGVGHNVFADDIRTGAVAMQLLRPADYQACWFAHDLARLVQTTVMRGVPIFILASLFFGLRLPPGVDNALLFAVSVGVGMALAVALTQATGSVGFWTLDVLGPTNIVLALSFFFSGQLVPLALWPDWLRLVAEWLPFQGLADVPFSIYLGRYAGTQALAQIGRQVLWVVLLLGLARLLIHRGFRRLEVQGG